MWGSPAEPRKLEVSRARTRSARQSWTWRCPPNAAGFREAVLADDLLTRRQTTRCLRDDALRATSWFPMDWPDGVGLHPLHSRSRFDLWMRVTPSFCLRRSLPKKHNHIQTSKTRLFWLHESGRVVTGRQGVKEMSTDTIGSHPTFICPDRG